MITKSELSIILSKLEEVKKTNIKLEQYKTDSEIASTVLWKAYMNNDIKDKIIADLGAGNGILGIGALLLGAKRVFFVEKDKNSIEVLKENLKEISQQFSINEFFIFNNDIKDFNEKVDTVIQNPPFGTKVKHADKEFLIKSFSIANKIYSFHKSNTKRFIDRISKDFGFKMIEEIKFNFPIKARFKFHKKRIKRIEVSCFYLVKISDY